MNGKGDKPRPLSVPRTEFDKNWGDAFGSTKRPKVKLKEKESDNHLDKTNDTE